MEKGTHIWCLIVILAVVGSVLSGVTGAAKNSAADSAVNITEEINNITNATISNLNETVLDNASSVYNVSIEGDGDKDGIDDYEEWIGHVGADSKTYFTYNKSESTDWDPFDDGQEIDGISPFPDYGSFGGTMPPRTAVSEPGRHPLVPAYPDIRVGAEKIEVIPKITITTTEGKVIGEKWSLETEITERTKTDWGVESGFSLFPFSIGIKPYYHNEYETIVKTKSSTSGWTKEEWSVATAIKTDEAARLKLHLKIKNCGTAKASDVQLKLRLKVGEKAVSEFWTKIIEDLSVGEEDEELIEEGEGEEEIIVTLDELKSIECGAPISIEVEQVNARVPFQQYWSDDWQDYYDMMDGVCAKFMINFGDGEVRDYRVYSGIGHGVSSPYPYIMNISIRDATNLLIGLEEREDGVYIGTAPYVNKPVKLENWTFGFDNETFQQINETLPENWTLHDLLNVTIKQGWVIVMKAPDIKPPEIHWVSYSRDMKTIKAGVSDNENITEVIAHVKVGDSYENVTLADEDGDLVFNATLPEETIDTKDDYIVASDGKFTTKGKILKPSVTIYVDDGFEDNPANHTWNTIYKGISDAEDGDTVIVYNGTYDEDIVTNKSITVILKGESNNRSIKAKGAIIGGDATLIVNNAIYIVNALYDYQYNISIKDSGTLILDNGSISTNWKFTLLTRINYSIYFGNISKYVNYTFYEKETVSTLITEKALSDYSKIENVQAYANCTLQKYTGFDISKAKNISTNITITQSYIQSYYKIKLNLSDNASFATKNDSKAVIYKISTTGQPEISISESNFENLTAIEGKADVIIAKSYMGDLEKLSANSVHISDSEIKNIGDDGLNYGDPGENASISIDSLDNVYISNTSMLVEGGDGKEGDDGGKNENGGNGGEGGNASISIGSDMNISIINSSLSSTGGNAGDGGDGADDVCVSCKPGNGGNGRYSGASLISIIGKSVSIINSSTSSVGGDAGDGGDGGDAGGWGNGEDGGNGGYGGVSLISTIGKSVSINNSSTSNAGGNAGNGGKGGYAGLWGDNGDGGDGGDGGYAPISFISDAWESFIKNSNLSSNGGNKGNGGWGHHYGDDGYLGDSSILFASKTLTTLDSNLQSIDYNGDSKISYMTFDCYTNLVNTTYTPFSVTSGNRVNICYWLTTNVTDEVGKPIENAQVKVTEDPSGIEVKTDYTDKNGISKMYLPSNITTKNSINGTAFVGNYFVHAFKNGYESDKEAILFTDNLQISLIITIPKPIVSISTDKDTYGPYEQQNVSIAIKNPADTSAVLKLGIGFKIYEIGGKPYEYEIPTLWESDLFEWPADFEWEFELKIPGLGLPNGKYAWTAYLKDDKGEIISRDEAVFNITGKAAVETPEEITRKIEKLEVPMFNIG